MQFMKAAKQEWKRLRKSWSALSKKSSATESSRFAAWKQKNFPGYVTHESGKQDLLSVSPKEVGVKIANEAFQQVERGSLEQRAGVAGAVNVT